MSDAVQLAIVAGIVTIATLVIKAIIDAHAKKVERVAAIEAAKVNQKLAEVEIKIDGRLTQLLELTKAAALAEGRIEGKLAEKESSTEAPALDGPTHLKIVEGEIKVTTDKKKPKK